MQAQTTVPFFGSEARWHCWEHAEACDRFKVACDSTGWIIRAPGGGTRGWGYASESEAQAAFADMEARMRSYIARDDDDNDDDV